MKKKHHLRVLHAAALLRPTAGILRQMQLEYSVAQEIGFPWSVAFYCPLGSTENTSITVFDNGIHFSDINSRIRKIKYWTMLRINYYRWLLEAQKDYDLLLLRYYVHDPFQLFFVKNCSKPVLFVHHTLEIPELFSGDLLSVLRGASEALIGRHTIKKASGLVAVTDEILTYEEGRSGGFNKFSHRYPNGISYSGDDIIIDERDDTTPEILFVASHFANWHGLDLLLNDLKRDSSNFILHLVGSLSKKDLASVVSDSRIRVHGVLSATEIHKIAERCWVGLSSFALDRKKMKEACTLKVREYLKLGLPVYANYQDIFPKYFRFYCRGMPVMKDILTFSYSMREFSKELVSKESRPYIDKKLLLMEFYDSLKNNFTR
jgi:glycosyltransferase involved in cell wall biosynthesis